MKSGCLCCRRVKITALSFNVPSACVISPREWASKLATVPNRQSTQKMVDISDDISSSGDVAFGTVFCQRCALTLSPTIYNLTVWQHSRSSWLVLLHPPSRLQRFLQLRQLASQEEYFVPLRMLMAKILYSLIAKMCWIVNNLTQFFYLSQLITNIPHLLSPHWESENI